MENWHSSPILSLWPSYRPTVYSITPQIVWTQSLAEEARQVLHVIIQGMGDFNVGSTAQTGLLVMTNKKEIKAALDSRPLSSSDQHVQIENVVTVAGTPRHGLILQFNIGFLSGKSQAMTNADITESYLQANVGFTRATNSLIMASPLVSQVSSRLWRRLWLTLLLLLEPSILGVFPLLLALVQIWANRQRTELAARRARIRRDVAPVDRLDQIKMSRLRLVLADGNRIRQTI